MSESLASQRNRAYKFAHRKTRPRDLPAKTCLTNKTYLLADVQSGNFDQSRPPRQCAGHTSASHKEQTYMATGTVKWFNGQKGYGFIQPDAGGPDIFVHISAVERSGMNALNEGQKINYEITQDRRTGKSSADQLSAA